MAIASPREVSYRTDVKEYFIPMTGSTVQVMSENGDRVFAIISCTDPGTAIGWDQNNLVAGGGHLAFTGVGNVVKLPMAQCAGLVTRAMYARGGMGHNVQVTEVILMR